MDSSLVLRFYRNGQAYDLTRAAVKSVLGFQAMDLQGASGVHLGALEGQPAVALEPAQLREDRAARTPDTAAESRHDSAAPPLGVVIGSTGDVLLALAADRIEAFPEDNDSAHRMDATYLEQTLRLV